MPEKQYTFEETPGLSRDEASVLGELAELLPGGEALRELHLAVSGAFAQLGAKGERASDGADLIQVTGGGLADGGEGPFCGVRVRVFLTMGGCEGDLILETSLEAARTVAARVIGVDRDKLAESELLTHLEKGVLAFFVERLIVSIGDNVTYSAGLQPLVMAGIGSESGEPDWGESGSAGWYHLTGRALIAQTPLPWRLLIPRKALAICRGHYQSSDNAAAHDRSARENLASRLGHAWVDLTGRLGAVRLSAAEVERLERNDIILFDGGGCLFDEKVVGGTLRLAPAGRSGANGSVIASVVEDGESLTVRIEAVVEGSDLVEGEMEGDKVDQEQDREDEMVNEANSEVEEGEGTAEQAESPPPDEGAALAGDVPLVLKVELGEVRMTLSELSKLGAGTILELHKDPAAPVALVVENRTMGRGELVKVEGELGVRILSLGN